MPYRLFATAALAALTLAGCSKPALHERAEPPVDPTLSTLALGKAAPATDQAAQNTALEQACGKDQYAMTNAAAHYLRNALKDHHYAPYDVINNRVTVAGLDAEQAQIDVIKQFVDGLQEKCSYLSYVQALEYVQNDLNEAREMVIRPDGKLARTERDEFGDNTMRSEHANATIPLPPGVTKRD